MRGFQRVIVAVLAGMCFQAVAFAETVGVFFDAAASQESFAAGDVKAALEAKGLTVEMLSLASLASSYANKKVVIARASNTAVTSVLTAQGGSAPTGLGEEAYALRTTTNPQTSFWALGGDATGAMYGGFQIAENIKFNGYAGTYNSQEAPFIKERGYKFNMPYDHRAGTYNFGNFNQHKSSAQVWCIKTATWEFSFWQQMIDDMVRNRYNMIAIWSNCHFTHMVKTTQYPLAALADVYDSGTTSSNYQSNPVILKKMTIEEKITHWKKVHAYAKSRGVKLYYMTWNAYVGFAEKVYPTLTDGDVTTPNEAFNYANMTKWLETYPDVDGFGCTAGENVDSDDEARRADYLWNSYGKPMVDFLKKPENSSRKLTFLHRLHMIDAANIMSRFAPLKALPNARMTLSFKYARCTMYSVAAPDQYGSDDFFGGLTQYGIKGFLTVRNDDLYLTHWGDPDYARAFINAIPQKQDILGLYIGGDGFTEGRVFHAKDALYQGKLEKERLWYREMIWGRVSYNPNVPKDVFLNHLKLRYGGQVSDINVLYTAWMNASRAFDVSNEFIRGEFLNDCNYYPENQLNNDDDINGGYVSATDFANSKPNNGSTLTDPNKTADSVQKMGLAAITTLNSISPGGNEELRINLHSVKALALLSLYVAEKFRGGRYNKAGNKTAAQAALSKAYCYYKEYAGIMDGMHKYQTFTRVYEYPTFTYLLDTKVLSDLTGVGGSKPTNCQPIVGTRPVSVSIDKEQPTMGVRALSTGAITLYLPGEQGFSVEIFKSNGVNVAKLSKLRNNKGVSRFVLGKKLPQGVYLVRLNSAGLTTIRQMDVVTK